MMSVYVRQFWKVRQHSSRVAGTVINDVPSYQDSASNLLVVKLGGSAITDKARALHLRRGTIASVARVLARHHDYMIVHGAGSFGHIPVRKYRLLNGIRSRRQLTGYAMTKASLLALEMELVSILAKEGVPVAPVFASSCLIANRGRIKAHFYDGVKNMLRLGLIPCIGGDLVQDLTLGASVVSGDQIAASLALAFHAKTIVFGTDVDGLFTADPKTDSKAELVTRVSAEELYGWTKKAGLARTPDVSGGMRGKLREILRPARAGVRVVIVNLNEPERLDRAMAGLPTTGTIIY
jgi:isopentenyl phosphate kinase